MDAIEFVMKYEIYIDEISQVIKPELVPILNELKETDPHDIVTPETYFINEIQARGLVWSLFVKMIKEIKK